MSEKEGNRFDRRQWIALSAFLAAAGAGGSAAIAITSVMVTGMLLGQANNRSCGNSAAIWMRFFGRLRAAFSTIRSFFTSWLSKAKNWSGHLPETSLEESSQKPPAAKNERQRSNHNW